MSDKFNNQSDLDRPDLNKCPDCLCYFAGDNCPLCGKPCPEHMKAGKRAVVRPAPRSKPHDPNAGRVVFVPWYHSLWFMIIISFFSPIVGIILFATSHHKRRTKIIAIVCMLLVPILLSVASYSYLFTGLLEGSPVNTELSREEYVGKCEQVSPTDYFRDPKAYDKHYVTMTLTVTERFYDTAYYYANSQYYVFYVCEDPENPEITLLVRDCTAGGSKSLIAGDTVVIYGEGAGEIYNTVDLNGAVHTAPLINGAHFDIVEDGGADGADDGNADNGADDGNTDDADDADDTDDADNESKL